MAISEIKRGKSTYITYGYGVDGKHYRIYCGIKGHPSTEKNLLKAKKKHFDDKIKHAKLKMFGV